MSVTTKINLSKVLRAYKKAIETGDKTAQALLEAAASGDPDKLISASKHLKTLRKPKK